MSASVVLCERIYALLGTGFVLLEKPYRHEKLGHLEAVPTPVCLILDVRVLELRDGDHATFEPVEVVRPRAFGDLRELRGQVSAR